MKQSLKTYVENTFDPDSMPWLSEQQIEALTHKKRPSAQVKALIKMRIDHRLRPDGTIVVLTATLEGHTKPVKVKSNEPNLEAV